MAQVMAEWGLRGRWKWRGPSHSGGNGRVGLTMARAVTQWALRWRVGLATAEATAEWAAADGSRRGPGLPPWILCPTALCVRQKIYIFLPKKSIFLSLSMFKSISSSLTVYFCPFFSLFFFHRFFFTHFSFFPLIFFSLFCHLLTLSCIRRQGLPGKARKTRHIRPCARVSVRRIA